MMHIVFRTLAQAKRVIIIVIGYTILVTGVVMIVLPGLQVIESLRHHITRYLS